jgi:aspartate kinase
MKTIVMKFGGAAVASPEHFTRIAEIIRRKKSEYNRIVVVVSAMGDTTDQLIELAKKVNPDPPRREYDMLITVGERISIALLAMALAHRGEEAVSFTGSQSGIITSSDHSNARIVDVKPHRVLSNLELGKTVIVAGFQGVSRGGEITTLGRGGSDTTAVALGVALGAEKVEFYKDVPWIYEENPKVNPKAKHLTQISYDEVMEIVKKGAEVLHDRCVELAKKNSLPLTVRSFLLEHEEKQGTQIGMTNQLRPDKLWFEENLE